MSGETEALTSAAFNALRLGRFREAADLATRLLEKNPSDAHALLFRALAFKGLGETDRAEEDLDRALTHDPSLARARWERALLFLETDRPVEAARDLDLYRRGNPEAFEALLLVGEARERAGDLDGALEAFRTAAERDPDRLEARLAHARLLLLRDPAAALPRLRALAALAPDLANVHALLGRALEAAGSPEEALAALEEEVRRQGRSAELEEEIGRLRGVLGRDR